MRIGMIAPPWLPVPPPAYGGTETVLDGLIHGLLQAGHEVVLVAHPDSATSAELRSVLPRDYGSIGTMPPSSPTWWARTRCSRTSTSSTTTPCRVPLSARGRAGVPVVVTHHGGSMTSPLRSFATSPLGQVVAISLCQAASASDIPIGAVVHHGIDVADFAVGDDEAARWPSSVAWCGEGYPSRHSDRPAAGHAPGARGEGTRGAADGILRRRASGTCSAATSSTSARSASATSSGCSAALARCSTPSRGGSRSGW